MPPDGTAQRSHAAGSDDRNCSPFGRKCARDGCAHNPRVPRLFSQKDMRNGFVLWREIWRAIEWRIDRDGRRALVARRLPRDQRRLHTSGTSWQRPCCEPHPAARARSSPRRACILAPCRQREPSRHRTLPSNGVQGGPQGHSQSDLAQGLKAKTIAV